MIFLAQLLLLLGYASCGSVVTLHNANDLIQLSRDVKNKTHFYGTTVLLDSDIDFGGGLSEQFFLIGLDVCTAFKGDFDGQGYVIKKTWH